MHHADDLVEQVINGYAYSCSYRLRRCAKFIALSGFDEEAARYRSKSTVMIGVSFVATSQERSIGQAQPCEGVVA